MPVLSTDLGKRIVEAFEAGGVTKKEVAARFDVSGVTVGNLVRLWREEGTLDPRYKGRSGRRPKIDGEKRTVLERPVAQRPDITLEELRETAGLDYALKRMGLGFKKTLRASEQDMPLLSSTKSWMPSPALSHTV